MAIWVSHF